jgi:hypothetical protein
MEEMSRGNKHNVAHVAMREWTNEDVRMLKALAREGTKTTAIARKLKRSVGATKQKALRLGVSLGAR